jgi:hypothetical protein
LRKGNEKSEAWKRWLSPLSVGKSKCGKECADVCTQPLLAEIASALQKINMAQVYTLLGQALSESPRRREGQREGNP